LTNALYDGANYGAATYGSGTYGYPVGSGPGRRNRLSKDQARLLVALEAEQIALEAAERQRALQAQERAARALADARRREITRNRKIAAQNPVPGFVDAPTITDAVLLPSAAERARLARQRNDEEALLMMLVDL
jgi:hypothetical protein